MQYPRYEMQNEAAQVDAFVQAMGQRESGSFLEQKHRRAHLASFELGLLCLRLTHPDFQYKSAQKKEIARVRSYVAPGSINDTVLDMIALKSSPAYITAAKQHLHKEAIRMINANMHMTTSNKIGRLAEGIGWGLLTRYAHPWLLAVPTLAHHEHDEATSRHYDTLLIATESGEQQPYWLQIKAGCTGRCSGKPSPNVDFDKYSKDVQLISGCCDLGMQHDGAYTNQTGRYLISEFDSPHPNKERVYELDVLTDTLLFNISAGLLPHGQAD